MRKKKELEILNPLDDNGEVKWGTMWHETSKLNNKQKFSASELKRLIKFKYGGAKIFCEVSGYDRGKLHTVLYGKCIGDLFDNRIKEIVDIIQKTENTHPKKYEVLDYDTRVWLKMRLYSKFGNIQKFCKIYPEFTQGYLAHVFRGRKKFMCPRMQRLVQIMNATYLEDQ